MDIHLHLNFSREFDPFSQLNHRLDLIMTALTDLQAAVAAESTVVDSAITLLNGLKAALDAAGTDPVALAALSNEIGAKTAALAAAVSADTPPALAPAPAPAPAV